mgnify:CR=1 FL=1
MLEEHLFPGEKLYLQRKRAKQTMLQSALGYGVTLHRYRRWEQDLRVWSDPEPPEVTLGGLEPWEHYIVLRLRSKMRQVDLANKLGMSRNTIVRMEQGKSPLKRLIAFWGE